MAEVPGAVEAGDALGDFPALAERLRGARTCAFFLDYDGTLAPIVERPERAWMSPSMRAAVAQLAARFPTAVVTGRSTAKVMEFVQLPELVYAGSHGFDIAGGGREDWGVPAAAQVPEMAPVVDELRARLREAGGVPGAEVEDNRFVCSVHYRRVAPADVPRLEAIVDAVVAARAPALEKRPGKMVFELRPQAQWHKGRAVRWLLAELGLAADDVAVVYIGDDVSDEDAFRELRELPTPGLGVLVRDDGESERPEETSASYRVRTVEEVEELLRRFACV